jgi:hypothetical protein
MSKLSLKLYTVSALKARVNILYCTSVHVDWQVFQENVQTLFLAYKALHILGYMHIASCTYQKQMLTNSGLSNTNLNTSGFSFIFWTWNTYILIIHT